MFSIALFLTCGLIFGSELTSAEPSTQKNSNYNLLDSVKYNIQSFNIGQNSENTNNGNSSSFSSTVSNSSFNSSSFSSNSTSSTNTKNTAIDNAKPTIFSQKNILLASNLVYNYINKYAKLPKLYEYRRL